MQSLPLRLKERHRRWTETFKSQRTRIPKARFCTHEISTIGFPKQDLHNNRPVNIPMPTGRFHKASLPDEELQATASGTGRIKDLQVQAT